MDGASLLLSKVKYANYEQVSTSYWWLKDIDQSMSSSYWTKKQNLI